MRKWVGFDLRSVKRGLYYGSAIGTGWTLAQILHQWIRCGGSWCSL